MAPGRSPRPAWDRLLDRSAPAPGGCLLWEGNLTDGYGQIRVGSRADGTRRLAYAHVVAYEHFVGPVPEGLELDHTCRVRNCVAPRHLEAVTHRENMGRSPISPGAHNAAKAACKRGHPFDEANTRIRSDASRACRTCERERARARGLDG